MALPTGQEVADKWLRRTKGSVEDYRAGVDRVTEAPGVKAAAQADLYIANLQASLDMWKKNVSGVSLDDWKQAAIDKGAGRIAAGVDAAMPHMPQTMANLMTAVESVKREVDATPRGDLETNIGRMTTMVRGMSKKKGTISAKRS